MKRPLLESATNQPTPPGGPANENRIDSLPTTPIAAEEPTYERWTEPLAVFLADTEATTDTSPSALTNEVLEPVISRRMVQPHEIDANTFHLAAEAMVSVEFPATAT